MVHKIVTGRDLRRMRLAAGKTPEEMAEILELKSNKTFTNWEKDLGGPDLNQWIYLVQCCGIDAAGVIDAAVKRSSVEEDIDFSKLLINKD